MFRQKKLVLIFLFFLLVMLQYRLFFGETNVFEIIALDNQISKQEEINDQLYERNEKLKIEILTLKQDKNSIEERARKELGMIKKNETLYQLVQ